MVVDVEVEQRGADGQVTRQRLCEVQELAVCRAGKEHLLPHEHRGVRRIRKVERRGELARRGLHAQDVLLGEGFFRIGEHVLVADTCSIPLRRVGVDIREVSAVAHGEDDDGNAAQGQKPRPDRRDDAEKVVPVEGAACRDAAARAAEKTTAHEGWVEQQAAENGEKAEKAHDAEEYHAALPHGEPQVQDVQRVHEARDGRRLHRAAAPRNGLLRHGRIGDLRAAHAHAPRAPVTALVSDAVEQKPMLGHGGDGLDLLVGILFQNLVESGRSSLPERMVGGGSRMGQRLDAVPLRDLLLEEKRQPREAKQEEKYCTDRTDPAVQTIEKQHE